jgi:hypothetical protein
MKFSDLVDRLEYLLFAAVLVPTLVVIAAAVVSISHAADAAAAREFLACAVDS